MNGKLYFIRTGKGQFELEYQGKRIKIEEDNFLSARDKTDIIANMLNVTVVIVDEWK